MTEADTDGSAAPDATDDGDSLGYDAPDGADVTIVTQGGPMRAFTDAVSVTVDEARFAFDDSGLSVSAVDPANVAMTDISVDADAFASYRAADITVGMPLAADGPGDLTTALSYARKGRGSQKGDPVRIDIFDGDESTRIRVAILRPDQQTKRVSWFYGIDPSMMRAEPDIPGLELPYRADPDVDAFVDAIRSMKAHDHAWLGADDRTFIIGSQASRNPHLDPDDDVDIIDAVEMPNRAWSIDHPDGLVEDADGSLFARGYLDQFADGLKAAKASRMTASFGDEIPVSLDFQNTDWGIDGQFMVAPRITQEDGEPAD